MHLTVLLVVPEQDATCDVRSAQYHVDTNWWIGRVCQSVAAVWTKFVPPANTSAVGRLACDYHHLIWSSSVQFMKRFFVPEYFHNDFRANFSYRLLTTSCVSQLVRRRLLSILIQGNNMDVWYNVTPVLTGEVFRLLYRLLQFLQFGHWIQDQLLKLTIHFKYIRTPLSWRRCWRGSICSGYIHTEHHTRKNRCQTFMPRTTFEPRIPLFEWDSTMGALTLTWPHTPFLLSILPAFSQVWS